MSGHPDDAKRPAYRVWGRMETLGPNDYTATATALPENGDPSEVRSLTQTLDSREAADQALDALMARVEELVRRAGGMVIERRKDLV